MPKDVLADDSRSQGRRPYGRIAAGVATAAATGLVAYWLRERALPEAAHTTLEADGAFSLRRYAPQVLATVEAQGSMIEALGAGYRRLNAYRTGRETRYDRGMAMTVPVTIAAAEQPGSWIVRIILPDGSSRGTLPPPVLGISIEERPARLVAAVRFPGRASAQPLLAAQCRELQAWMDDRGLNPVGNPEFAAYNAAIIPGPARRNEWWCEVRDR